MKKANQGFVLWFTGLPASGKTTGAEAMHETLLEMEYNCEKLDGDIVRENLTKGLSFSRADRDENLRRIAFVANLLSRNGVIVLASFIAPYREQRDYLRNNIHNFIEIFVDAPLQICESRDPKGMYKKARQGEIKNFTGINDPYEPPKNPDIHLKTADSDPKENAKKIINYLTKNRFIK